ncbi:tetratricopeptide repeat protein [Stenotrophomonas sp. MMGLT7]|uniref:YfgM family protein n=1 Tax=Stenotrophomonas sp. MMGLT7 TaxID=2901227 RepID=UPI001E59A4F1|nr:tetratricopeptide repeat protein [Stenotrophomonas sp. MMGLT7]MCD7098858.1 tetratricopeptide repeat protein [Stenotrophomonas sp. MMGLT7]
MAIDDLLDEHEQSERVRSWLRSNGAAVIGGVVIALAAILGWQWWQKHSHNQLAEANARYEGVLGGIQSNNLEKAAKDMAGLEQGRTGIYTDLAALRLAKAQVEAGKSEDAIKTLRGVKASGEFQLLIDQRLARLLVDAGKPDEALKLLASAEDNISLEIRGDALIAQGKRDQARDLYAKSLATLDVAAPQRRLVEMKLMDAGGVVPDPAEPI